MYAMQYQITLPADYNMTIIRSRVASRGARTDHFEDLGLKAYLIQERGKNGAVINQYAPFYLWAGIKGMNRFLWGGGGFEAVVESFGRPVVNHWTGVGFARGPSQLALPSVAILRAKNIGPSGNLIEISESARGELHRRASLKGVFATAIAIDPAAWTLLHFTLCESAELKELGQRYEVLHLSRPCWDALSTEG
jgi:hypothetical protein